MLAHREIHGQTHVKMDGERLREHDEIASVTPGRVVTPAHFLTRGFASARSAPAFAPEQLLDAGPHLVAELAHAGDGFPLRVLEGPVLP